ncbi:hypothetical protein CYY_001773 [Polysphondylium violaceum]|uniref:Ankyrin repeat-containing protein n=1 Tax=Polysphondylium violaceum TaxID=133409 RepID=A0A8J4V1C4_9MYCE|nr:hypothetical protein CYY_001773 [Polysphondylium violaceum]
MNSNNQHKQQLFLSIWGNKSIRREVLRAIKIINRERRDQLIHLVNSGTYTYYGGTGINPQSLLSTHKRAVTVNPSLYIQHYDNIHSVSWMLQHNHFGLLKEKLQQGQYLSFDYMSGYIITSKLGTPERIDLFRLLYSKYHGKDNFDITVFQSAMTNQKVEIISVLLEYNQLRELFGNNNNPNHRALDITLHTKDRQILDLVLQNGLGKNPMDISPSFIIKNCIGEFHDPSYDFLKYVLSLSESNTANNNGDLYRLPFKYSDLRIPNEKKQFETVTIADLFETIDFDLMVMLVSKKWIYFSTSYFHNCVSNSLAKRYSDCSCADMYNYMKKILYLTIYNLTLKKSDIIHFTNMSNQLERLYGSGSSENQLSVLVHYYINNFILYPNTPLPPYLIVQELFRYSMFIENTDELLKYNSKIGGNYGYFDQDFIISQLFDHSLCNASIYYLKSMSTLLKEGVPTKKISNISHDFESFKNCKLDFDKQKQYLEFLVRMAINFPTWDFQLNNIFLSLNYLAIDKQEKSQLILFLYDLFVQFNIYQHTTYSMATSETIVVGISKGWLEFIEFILDPERIDNFELPVDMYNLAISHHNQEMVELFLSKSIPISNNALDTAVEMGNLSIIKLLNNEGKTPIKALSYLKAADNLDLDVLEYLIDNRTERVPDLIAKCVHLDSSVLDLLSKKSFFFSTGRFGDPQIIESHRNAVGGKIETSFLADFDNLRSKQFYQIACHDVELDLSGESGEREIVHPNFIKFVEHISKIGDLYIINCIFKSAKPYYDAHPELKREHMKKILYRSLLRSNFHVIKYLREQGLIEPNLIDFVTLAGSHFKSMVLRRQDFLEYLIDMFEQDFKKTLTKMEIFSILKMSYSSGSHAIFVFLLKRFPQYDLLHDLKKETILCPNPNIDSFINNYHNHSPSSSLSKRKNIFKINK